MERAQSHSRLASAKNRIQLNSPAMHLLAILFLLISNSNGANQDSSLTEMYLQTQGKNQNHREGLIWQDVYPSYFLFELERSTQLAYAAFLIANLTIALYAKSIIFRSILEGLSSRPVNLLILVDQVNSTLYRSTNHLLSILLLVLNVPLINVVGETVCQVLQWMNAFGLAY